MSSPRASRLALAQRRLSMAGNIPCSPSITKDLISRVLAQPAVYKNIYSFTSHHPQPLSHPPPSMSTRARSTRSTASSTNNNRLRKPRPPRVQVPEPVHWLFRTNIPRKRQSYIPASPRKRNFFGMGEIIGVVTNVCRTPSSSSAVLTPDPTTCSLPPPSVH